MEATIVKLEEGLTELALVAAAEDPELESHLLTRMLEARPPYRMELLAEIMERAAGLLARWAKIARQEASDRR